MGFLGVNKPEEEGSGEGEGRPKRDEPCGSAGFPNIDELACGSRDFPNDGGA